MSKLGSFGVVSIVILGLLSLWSGEVRAGTITVGSTADAGPGSLRAALAQAANGDTVRITARGTITLTSGELVVNRSILISGPGASRLTISGNDASRVFHVNPGLTVTIAGITITNGKALGAFPANAGGGIFNDRAVLTVNGCIIAGNSARLGGGIFSRSGDGASTSLTLNNSTVSSNSARYGGGIFSGGGSAGAGPTGESVLKINGSTVNGNSAGFGGGIFNDGFSGTAMATITNSVVSNNLAKINGFVAGGGGIYNNGDSGVAILVLTNSTVSGNVAGLFITNPEEENPYEPGSGGGIYNDGLSTVRPGNAQVTLDNTKITGNKTHGDGTAEGGFGGGIRNESRDQGRAVVTGNLSNIDENTAEEGGGGIYNFTVAGESTIALTGSSVNGNLTNHGASAIQNQGLGSDEDAEMHGTANLTLSHTTVRVNAGGSEAISSLLGNGGGRANLNMSSCDVSDNLGAGLTLLGQGGILTTTISNSVIRRNSSDLEGGGIANLANNGSSTLTVTGSLISQNYGRSGGGIANISNVSGPATLIIDRSTISDNHATAATGGGILNEAWGTSATATISNSTLSGNFADGDFTPNGYGFGGGGGVFNIQRSGGVSTVELTNCTLSGNSTEHNGGAIVNYAETSAAGRLMPRITLNNCTISDNSAAQGDSIWNGSQVDTEPCTEPDCIGLQPGAAMVDFANTIFNSPALGENIQNVGPGTITSRGYNLSSDAAGGDGSTGPGGWLNGPGDIRNTDPMLKPLGDYGGPTLTHSLSLGSPAINTGDPNFAANLFDPPMLYDQRGGPGFVRVFNGRIDIGAFEAKHP